MHAVRSFQLPRRRTLMLGVAILAAVLLAAALVLEPPRTDRGSGDSRTTIETGIAGGGGSVDGGGIADATGEPALREPAMVDPAAPVDARAAESDAAVAPDGAAATDLAAPEGGTIEAIGAGTGTIAPPELDARIIRTGSIELRVDRGDFESAWGDVQAAARAHGGYIVAASRSGAGDGPRAGTITMRVPTARFDAAVDRLRETSDSKVRRLDVVSQDVTQEFVDVRSRLRHDRAVEGRLLALLAQTKGVSEVLAVQSRLDQVQEQIELSKGRLQYLEKMTAMSTIEATITAPASPDRGDERDPNTLGQSFDEAGERFVGNVAGAIVWLGGALPTLVLLALIAVAARVAWRRSRP